LLLVLLLVVTLIWSGWGRAVGEPPAHYVSRRHAGGAGGRAPPPPPGGVGPPGSFWGGGVGGAGKRLVIGKGHQTQKRQAAPQRAGNRLSPPKIEPPQTGGVL
jgi:hypothetical protein